MFKHLLHILGAAILVGACQQHSDCTTSTLSQWANDLNLDSVTINVQRIGINSATVTINDVVELDSSTCSIIAGFAAYDLIRSCGGVSQIIINTREGVMIFSPRSISILSDSVRYTGRYRELVIDIISASGRDDILKLNSIFPMLRSKFQGFTYEGDLWGVLSDYINERRDFSENPEEILALFLVSCDYPEFNIQVPGTLRSALKPWQGLPRHEETLPL